MLSRVFRLGTTFVVLGCMAVSAGAQGPGGRGGPGGGRGFTMGPTGTASELMGLLATPEIRKEVKLSDEGFAAVDKLLKENEAARGGGRGPGGPGGPGAGGPGGPGGGQPDAEREARMKQMRENMAAGQKKIDEAVLAALSDEQKKSLETLKGAKFEFPESLRSGFGGMRGGFGGGFAGGFGGPGGPGGGRGGEQSEEEREKARAEREQRMKDAAKKAQEMLDEVLPPEGMDRLIGLYVQLRGNASITGELPSKKLGLNDGDIKKINEVVGKLRTEQMQEMMQNFGGGRGNRQGGGRPNSESGT